MTPIKLTLKTAKAILKQEFGLSGATLGTECANGVAYIYTMHLGQFVIKIQNDWFARNGLYKVAINAESSGSLWLYYDPKTLERNHAAEDKLKECEKADMCADCSRVSLED